VLSKKADSEGGAVVILLWPAEEILSESAHEPRTFGHKVVDQEAS